MSEPAGPHSAAILSIIRDALEDEANVQHADIHAKFEWYDAGDNKIIAVAAGGTDDEAREPFSFRILAYADSNGTWLMPCNNWDGKPTKYDQPFYKNRARVSLIAGDDPVTSLHFAPQMDGLRTIFTRAPAAPPGARATHPLITAQGSITTRHCFFTAPQPTDVTRTERAQAQEALNIADGPEFRSINVPCKHAEGRTALHNTVGGGEHAYIPLAAWKMDFNNPVLREDTMRDGASVPAGSPATREEALAGDAMPTMTKLRPNEYDRHIRGSLVDVRFTLTRQFIPTAKTFNFMADIEDLYVLHSRPPPAALKRGRGASKFLASSAKRLRFE
ncbi:unnamed protein product [Peniophora sp. CBMAI 1063]|nr:unnamed protein product [Peniophora sp. CBMAI 1063]